MYNASTLPCVTKNLCICENCNAGKAKLNKCYFLILTFILLVEKDGYLSL